MINYALSALIIGWATLFSYSYWDAISPSRSFTNAWQERVKAICNDAENKCASIPVSTQTTNRDAKASVQIKSDQETFKAIKDRVYELTPRPLHNQLIVVPLKQIKNNGG